MVKYVTAGVRRGKRGKSQLVKGSPGETHCTHTLSGGGLCVGNSVDTPLLASVPSPGNIWKWLTNMAALSGNLLYMNHRVKGQSNILRHTHTHTHTH